MLNYKEFCIFHISKYSATVPRFTGDYLKTYVLSKYIFPFDGFHEKQ